MRHIEEKEKVCRCCTQRHEVIKQTKIRGNHVKTHSPRRTQQRKAILFGREREPDHKFKEDPKITGPEDMKNHDTAMKDPGVNSLKNERHNYTTIRKPLG